MIRNDQTDAILHDLETNMPGAVPTISHHVSMINGHVKNRDAVDIIASKINGHIPGRSGTGSIAPLLEPVDYRHMLEEAEQYAVNSYM